MDIVAFRIVRGALAQQAEHALGGGQIAGRQQYQQPLAGLFEQLQLAEGGNVIDTGIGARIGCKQQAILQVHGDAISHGG